MLWTMRRFPSRLVLFALVAGFLAAPSAAQAPRMAPDFYATIAVAGFERPVEVRQSGLKRRLDIATGGLVQSYITDRTRGALIVLSAAGRRRIAFVFPLAQEEVAQPLPLDLMVMQDGKARLTRIGSSSVAGRSCQLWRYLGYLGRSGTICSTAEGVILQLTPDGRATPLFQVLTLVQTVQDPRWFTVPADYEITALPGMGGLAVRPAPVVAPTPAR
ncbi:MAG: hypothetical protein JSR45_06825 [Proteobacteria bacterium]|nr:hypothetical protein [Pseudomonadota bacterium]